MRMMLVVPLLIVAGIWPIAPAAASFPEKEGDPKCA